MSSELVHRGPRNTIIWSPELLAALTAERAAGKPWQVIADNFGIALTRIRVHVGPVPNPENRVHPHNAQGPLSAPPIPAPRRLPCGCYRGHPCERAQALRAAMDAEAWGTAAWEGARQGYFRHLSGEEAREGAE